MIIQGMIVAPERSTIGQPLEPSQSPPDRQPVGDSQSRDHEDRQQRPSRSTGRSNARPNPPGSPDGCSVGLSDPCARCFVGKGNRIEVNHGPSRQSAVPPLPRSDRSRRVRQVRPAGFEPATKGFKSPRVSTRLGLSHPPRVGSSPGLKSVRAPGEIEHDCGGRALVGGDYCWDSPR